MFPIFATIIEAAVEQLVRQRRANGRSAPAVCEAMELRRHLTVSCSGTTSVTCTGDSAGDVITVDISGGNVRVREGTTTRHSNSSTTSVVINAGGGNDAVNLENSLTDSIYVTVNGEGGDDILTGSDRDGLDVEQFHGGDGYDEINTMDGGDYATGGADSDTLQGGADYDSLYGGDGNDTVRGGAGSDYVIGDDGDDSLDGEADQDSISGGAGNDTLIGDTLSGAEYADGGDGADSFLGFLDQDFSDTVIGDQNDSVFDTDNFTWGFGV